MIQERIAALRTLMEERDIDYYLIPSNDFHSSEYVGDYFMCRKYMSGFTGSAGTLVVGREMAGLWTDGRYFLQAGKQLEGTGITLFKSGEPEVPTVQEYLAENMKNGGTLAADGRVITKAFMDGVKRAIKEKHYAEVPKISFLYEEDLVDQVWKDRPQLTTHPVMELGVEYAGKSRADKLKEIRDEMIRQQADYFLLTSLDDIAWLLNIRGGDVDYNPVVRSYFMMGREESRLYAEESAFPAEVVKALRDDKVVIKPYNAVYEDVKMLPDHSTMLWDEAVVNYTLIQRMNRNVTTVNQDNLTLMPKAVKNPVEVENERKAHVKDGVAMCRFLCWLDKAVQTEEVTEISAAEKLESFRSQQEHYQGQSFAPIIGYAEHGAIIHYSATKESSVCLLPKSFVLMDTGAQFLEGTTDITRTVALGPVTEEQKTYFTAVLKGNLDLVSVKFPKGTSGLSLDVLARHALWDLGYDYKHGTGHGVGFFLNVHEGPNAFRSKSANKRDQCAMVPGMITSDEPGAYLEGKFGIRLENMIVCCEDETEGFLHFDPLTLVPFDLRAVDKSMLTAQECAYLNDYHKLIFNTVSPYLNEEETAWLANATRAI